MPLEIRELIIKATIGDEETKSSNATSTANANVSGSQGVDINLILEKVMEIIKEKTER